MFFTLNRSFYQDTISKATPRGFVRLCVCGVLSLELRAVLCMLRIFLRSWQIPLMSYVPIVLGPIRIFVGVIYDFGDPKCERPRKMLYTWYSTAVFVAPTYRYVGCVFAYSSIIEKTGKPTYMRGYDSK